MPQQVLLASRPLEALQAVRDGLEAAGHRVVVADDINDVLGLARAHRVDLVVLTEELEGGTGADVCAVLSGLPGHSPLLYVGTEHVPGADAIAPPGDPGRILEQASSLLEGAELFDSLGDMGAEDSAGEALADDEPSIEDAIALTKADAAASLFDEEEESPVPAVPEPGAAPAPAMPWASSPPPAMPEPAAPAIEAAPPAVPPSAVAIESVPAPAAAAIEPAIPAAPVSPRAEAQSAPAASPADAPRRGAQAADAPPAKTPPADARPAAAAPAVPPRVETPHAEEPPPVEAPPAATRAAEARPAEARPESKPVTEAKEPPAAAPESKPVRANGPAAAARDKAFVEALLKKVREADYFEILGVTPDADTDAVCAAHASLRASLDEVGTSIPRAQLEEVAAAVDEARDVLREPALRAAYARNRL